MTQGGHERLIAEAEGLNRASVMKDLFGGALSRFLRPIYEPVLQHGESIPERIATYGDVHDFIYQTVDLLDNRITARTDKEDDLYDEIAELVKNREDLFYFESTRDMIRDGALSGLVVPFTIAANIFRVEHETSPPLDEQFAQEPFDYESIIEILNRDSFDGMLQHLTKGPFGFLGASSSVPKICQSTLFDFKDKSGQPLSIWSAYQLHGGRVASFSSLYHLAALRRRDYLKQEYEAAGESKGSHARTDSSGCPMRYEFTDDMGEKQKPIVTIEKEFLLFALALSATQPGERGKKKPDNLKKAQAEDMLGSIFGRWQRGELFEE